tara:strand:- start:536 stop:754 length:219 start_codon:yes stop_codon:yes gene_type:complete
MIDLGNMNTEEWNQVAVAGGVGAMDYRDRVIELVEDGNVDPMMMLIACVKYMSQDECKDMLEINELLEDVSS